MLEKRQMFSGAVLVWNATAAAAAATTADGPLTWDTTTTEWTNQATGDPASWSNADSGGCEQAVFPAGMDPASILVNGPIDVASIEFESSGIALSGNSLVLPSTGGSIDPLVGWSEIDSSIQGGPLSVGGGGATLILGGSNSYTGGTTAPSTLITAGTLQVGRLGSSNTLGNSTLGAGAVNLSSGATLAFDLNAPTTFSNNIQLSSGSQTISILGSTTTLSGVISGGGSVLVTNPIGDGGSGTPGDPQPDLVMGGSNTYTGSTTITNNADVSVPGSIASNNVIVDPGSSLSTEPESFDSPTHLQDDGSFDYTDPTPEIDSTDTDVVVSGNGLLTVTGGKLIVQGSNTFSGATNVSYGTLSLQNLNSSGTGTGTVTVMAGSTLDGTGGTQGAVTVDNGGFLTAGSFNAIGLSTVGMLSTGDVAMDTGSTLAATINGQYNPGTDYDQLNITGGLTIGNGANLSLSGQPAVELGASVTLVTTTDGITGRFANVVYDPSNATTPDTVTLNGETFAVNYNGGTSGDDLVLTLIYAPPTLSMVEEDSVAVAGQPVNFQLKAIGSAGADISGWTILFTNTTTTTTTTQTITGQAEIAAGGVYIWEFQHIFPPSVSSTPYNVSASPNHNVVYSMSQPADLAITVGATPGTGADSPLYVSGAIPQSSTAINVYFVSTVNLDNTEVAAEDMTAGASTYTVVGAGEGADVNDSSPFLGKVNVSGLIPDHTYQFLVYGITGSGSLCSSNSVSQRTFAAPTLSVSTSGSQTTYTAYYDALSLGYHTTNDSNGDPVYEDLLAPQWQAFDSSGDPITTTGSPTNSANTSTMVFNTNPAYVTFDATAKPLFTETSGAFDSITYYNVTPTYVVTGNSSSNVFNVSVDSNYAYTITGSVSPIPTFYAPNGINLKVYGRGGTDLLDAGANAEINLVNDPQADGTTFNVSGSGFVGDSYQPPGLPPPVPGANLTLPAPQSPIYTAIPTAGDTFTPPVATATGSGRIIQATATAAPGDVIALTADDVVSIPGMSGTTGSSTPNATVDPTEFWVYGQTTSGNADWDQATVISEAAAGSDSTGSVVAVSLQLPANLPAHSIYFLYEKNFVGEIETTYSQPYVINQPQVWWTSSANSHQDGTASVFGTNLSYGLNPSPYADQSWVYLFPSDQNGTITPGAAPIILPETAVAADPISGAGAMDVNEYKVDFKLPANVTANIYYYQVEIYNGHGGWYGMSHAVAGSNSPTMITVPAALVTQTYPLLSAVDGYAAWKGVDSISIYDGSSTQLSPTAVNDAISWANDQAESFGYSFVNIQLPPGLIEVTDTSDIVKMAAYVHLIGAGDTGNSSTGTVIEAEYGAGVEGLVEFPSIPAPNESGNTGLSDMSLDANGGINVNPDIDGDALGGVVFDEGQLTGLTLERLTIDATNDDPSQPNFVGQNVLDLHINGGATYLQILDSTLIGAGLYGELADAVIDNCHFIGTGPAAVISTEHSNDVSITRCTDTGLVNNILCPGGDVMGDSNQGLLEAFVSNPGLYVGDNRTSGVYHTNSTGDGEEISVEPGYYDYVTIPVDGVPTQIPTEAYNSEVAIYQNTLSGDGAESLGVADTIGISVSPGFNIVVADNDVSNVGTGIYSYNNGGNVGTQADPVYEKTYMPFAMFTDNSIHNCVTGIYVFLSTVDSELNTPWFIGCSYSGNIISGGQPGSTGILINPYADQSNDPAQFLMNVFNADVVTGVAIGLDLNTHDLEPTNEVGTLVLSNGFFSSDGSTTSALEQDLFNNSPSAADYLAEPLQGFWSLLTTTA